MLKIWATEALIVCIILVTHGGAQQTQITPSDSKQSRHTFASFDFCEASSSYPGVGTDGSPMYSPSNALKKGSGYWSSEGNHLKDSIVTVTLSLKSRRTTEGIEIHWAYAPGQVSVLASFTGEEPYLEIIPFQDVSSNEDSLDQQIYFSSPVRAKSFRLAMKNPQKEFIGINFVQLICGGSPIVHILSSITSVQDMCMLGDEQNDVVLVPCVAAVGRMDGRSLWKFNEQGQIANIPTNACIVLKDNSDADGGAVVLDDCFTALNFKDGRSIWELQPNNQLKLMKGGNWCFSQVGSKAGSSDVALNKHAATSHARMDDSHHGPQMAVDGDADTYWASQDFPLDVTPDSVFFDIDLGDKYKLSSLAINWEYPAMEYVVNLSVDGKSWMRPSSNTANSMHETLDDLHSIIAQYIRIELKKPHPVHGKVGESALFGIKTASVYSNRLRSIVEDCEKAKSTPDVRDKFFLQLVPEVDLSSPAEFGAASSALQNVTSVVAQMAASIDDLHVSMTVCQQEKLARRDKLMSLHSTLAKLWSDFAEAEDALQLVVSATSSTKEGYSREHPLEDCYALRSKDPQATSGFFYIHPPCAPTVLRVFCDVNSGSSYFVPPETDITELKDTKLTCASYGLKPVQLHSPSQLAGMHTMLRLMGIDLHSPVPIAVDDGSGSYYDLALEVEVGEFLKDAVPSNPGQANTIGIGAHGLTSFDSSSTDMSAIICSTNKDFNFPPPTALQIGCKTTLQGTPYFAVPTGAQVLVKCPDNCIDVEAEVIGANIYAEESSVCLAAIHSGTYDKAGQILVTVTLPPDVFESKYQNGIKSDSYMGSTRKRAFQVQAAQQQCPDVAAMRSFLEVNVVEQFGNMGTSEQLVVSLPTSASSASENESQPVNSDTARSLQDMLAAMKFLPGFDSNFVKESEEMSGRSVSAARGILKPASTVEHNLREESADLLIQAESFTNVVKTAMEQYKTLLQSMEQRLGDVMRERAQQSSADSWTYLPFNEYEFMDVFTSSTSSSVIGVGHWQMPTSAVGEREPKNMICQTAGVEPADPASSAVGTFLWLKNKQFYDAIYTADVYISGSGSVGFVFRLRDNQNMYMFEMRQQHGGFKRLIRVVDGQITELARKDDGGFVEDLWVSVRIEMRQASLKISVTESPQQPAFVSPSPMIYVMDGSLVSGSVGFFTSGSLTACWDKPKVVALSCLHQDSPPPPPKPPLCSIFRESFFGHFASTWHPIEADDSRRGPSDWRYMTNVGGEHKVIAQMSEVSSFGEDQAPTVLALKRNKGCESGTFSFSFFPQCDAGIIGGVFKLIDSHNYAIFEMGSSFARIRHNINGDFSTLARSSLPMTGYQPSKWNKVTITFNGASVTVNLGSRATPIPVFSVMGFEAAEGGTIGLSSYNCGGVAFKGITLHPLDENAPSVMPIHAAPPILLETKSSGLDFCLKKTHIVERLEFCRSKLASSISDKRCRSNFCDTCCDDQFPGSAKARVTCKNHCHEGDHLSLSSGNALSFIKENCTLDQSKRLYAVCSKEGDEAESCLFETCSMCCKTVKIPSRFNQNSREKALLIGECERQCKSDARKSTPHSDSKYTVISM